MKSPVTSPVKPLLAGVALGLLAGWPALAAPPVLRQLGQAGGQAGTQESREAAANVLQERQQRFQPVWSARGMVAAGEPLAAQAGARLLAAGGNAVDAAVATSFALAVTLPHSTGIGGGGFLLLWLPGTSAAPASAALSAATPAAASARSSACAAARAQELPLGRGFALGIDFRESAPAAAAGNLFLDAGGTVDRRRATTSLLSTAVPGTVAGLLLAQRCYGRLPLDRVLAPAIALAGEGVPVSKNFSQSLAAAAPLLLADPGSRALFFRVDRRGGWRPLQPGERLQQPQLAASLRRIAAGGNAGFYQGPSAEALVRLMRRGGGLISADDLRAYRAKPVRPLQIRFHGNQVLGLPPPAGGITVLQLLRMLERFDLAALGLNSAATLHLMGEAMNLAYRERNAGLGDGAEAPQAWQRWLADGPIQALVASINPLRHRPAAQLLARPAVLAEGDDTTHVSVADGRGGLVATTSSINFSYGNGVTVPGAGFLLNNHMDDFTAKPGSANGFGLVQGRANAIRPGRRPLSSMAPTLVFRPDGSPWLATGSPGGSRIATTVVQVLLNRLVHGLNLAAAVAEPRIHSQLLPDRLEFEQGLNVDTRRLLQGMGHLLQQAAAMGAAQSVELIPPQQGGGSYGVTDTRRAWALAQPEE